MKKNNLQKAKNLFDLADSELDHYICLELRMAIEHHVYKKLNFYLKRYGTKLLYRYWQPNKAMKVLNQLEPRSDQSYLLAIARETSGKISDRNFKNIGKHEALNIKWLNKHYNKLGSFLHIEGESLAQLDVKREYLNEIITELERAQSGQLLSSFANLISFSCPSCGEKIEYCVDALPDIDEVICPSNDCNASYKSINDGKDWYIERITVDSECPDCGFLNKYAPAAFSIGHRLTCGNCPSKFQITHYEWKYAKISDKEKSI